MLKNNLFLNKNYLDNYIIKFYENDIQKEGFWNRLFSKSLIDHLKLTAKKDFILAQLKDNNIIDLIKAVCFSIKSPVEFNFANFAFLLKDKILIINQAQPAFDMIPDHKDITFNSKSIKEVPFKKGEKESLLISYYNQVALTVTNLLFQADEEDELFDEIVYNGWIQTRDKTTGHLKTVCVVSLNTNKSQFSDIQLMYVDPIKCVNMLYGRTEQNIDFDQVIGVTPFLNFDEDSKVVQAESVIENLHSSTNLMELTWEKFEVLVRDWLRKEFEGSKVEVTQSSRDGGVDAIIYDSDYLKGGITLVQVKQYNIVVPVSAIRDLYGVMHDRRASKGILVTTSDFGHDSRQFVEDKAISLVNGKQLLYYLSKHGYNAEIKKIISL